MISDLKSVICRPLELSSGCVQMLSTLADLPVRPSRHPTAVALGFVTYQSYHREGTVCIGPEPYLLSFNCFNVLSYAGTSEWALAGTLRSAISQFLIASFLSPTAV